MTSFHLLPSPTMSANFIPLEPVLTSGFRPGQPAVLYSVVPRAAKSGERLRIYLRPDMAKAMGLKQGDLLRLDGDLTAGLGRLVRVATKEGQATREVEVRKSGSGVWLIRRSGLVAEAFPSVAKGKTVELRQARVTADGLVFELPIRGAEEARESEPVIAPLPEPVLLPVAEPVIVPASKVPEPPDPVLKPAVPIMPRKAGARLVQVPTPAAAPSAAVGRGGVWGGSKLVPPEKGQWCESAFHTRAHYVVQGVALCGERVPDVTRWRGLKHGGKRCAICLAASGD